MAKFRIPGLKIRTGITKSTFTGFKKTDLVPDFSLGTGYGRKRRGGWGKRRRGIW